VLAVQGVGAGRVHQRHLAQQRHRSRELVRHLVQTAGPGRLAPAEHVNARRGRRDALSQGVGAQKRVQQCTLAGVELSHHDEQEQFVQLGHRQIQRREVIAGGVVHLQFGRHLVEQPTFLVQDRLLIGCENPLHRNPLSLRGRPASSPPVLEPRPAPTIPHSSRCPDRGRRSAE
jgi:hypothetical protein